MKGVDPMTVCIVVVSGLDVPWSTTQCQVFVRYKTCREAVTKSVFLCFVAIGDEDFEKFGTTWLLSMTICL